MDFQLDSGIFADRNRDGVTDCADVQGVTDDYFDAVLGDSYYRFEFDYELDGVVSANDKLWVYVTVLPGDLNADGTVGQPDVGILLSAWGSTTGDPNWNPIADLDHDGTIGQSDMGILMGNYGQSC